jgi:mannonate dehydratase
MSQTNASANHRETTPAEYPLSVVPGYHGSRPGIQLGTQLPPDASPVDMAAAVQMGVEWVMTSVPSSMDSPVLGAEAYRAVRRRFEDHGLKVYRIANHRCHNMPSVTLNLEDRDQKIEEYLRYIRDLGEAGIRYATYAHMANGIWSSGTETVRGGATGRALRLDADPVGRWIDRRFRGELTHGREYSPEEIWENYQYFIERVVPVAEEARVRIGVHPDDPPVYSLGGVPRCVFGNFEGYRRALELADSPNIGMCLCVGCWLEGGPGMGKDVVSTIRYFGERGKLFKVHFRNITAPLPDGFAETYLDDGYMQMPLVMRELHRVGFDGAVISDHLPKTAGGRERAESFSIGYIRGLIDTVQALDAG